jgi:hypothetical protein
MRRTGRPRTLRQVLRTIAGTLVLILLLASCTSARSSLGTSDSSCYLALPTATQAVHGHGRFVGVHLFTLKTLSQRAPQLFHELAHGQSVSERVCVSAFEGQFTRASVSKPVGRSAGKLVVVVTTTPANRLLGTMIVARPPLHFGHGHFA